jgi:hypothetical protein
MLEREAHARQLDRERAERERELRDRMAALEIERLQAEISLRAAERAAQDASERLHQEQSERERLAAEVVARQRAVAEVTEQLREESARRSRISAEATDRERELRARLAELEQAGQKAAADLALRARTSAEETIAEDQQIATIEHARREAEARVAAVTQQAQTLTAHPPGGIASPVVGLPSPSEPQNRQMAAINPDAPPSLGQGQLVFEIKTELSRLGCYFAPIDSNWQTPELRKAIKDFAARTHRNKVPEDPAPQLLEDLKARSGRVCVTTCGPREQERDGRCVAKVCAGTEVLDRDGNCVPRGEPKPSRPAVANTAPRPHRTEPPATGHPGRGSCFNFNGRQFCE